MEEVRYFLVPGNDSVDISDDLTRMISTLSSIPDIDVEKDIDGKYILHSDGNKSTLQIEDDSKEAKIILSCSKTDGLIVTYLKQLCTRFSYKVFNPTLGVYLPQDYFLLDLVTTHLKPENREVISSMNLEPLFRYNNTDIIFARTNSGQIHLINQYLLDYFRSWGVDEKMKREFSYEVAPSLQRFVLYYDRRLIPMDFYDYYGRSFKIINESGFNIKDPGRKVFIKPFILEINDDSVEFYTGKSKKGRLLHMDKIRKGETLDDSLKRVINDLGVAKNYIRAFVSKDIEFDRDKKDRLIPRLIIAVYIEQFLKKPEKMNRGWVSEEDID